MKGDLIVEFTGRMIIPKKDRPDDRGSCGHWLVNELAAQAEHQESTDGFMDHFDMEIELIEGD